MRDIKAMLPEEIAAALAEMGQPKYRAKQIFQWLARGASSFDEMTEPVQRSACCARGAVLHLQARDAAQAGLCHGRHDQVPLAAQ